MKINKLLAGGLMTVVACALAGSITGTFAWYQYALNSTVSMHGVSVSTSKNLYLKGEYSTDFATDDLQWADLAGLNADKVALRPTSNGKNNGSSALNESTANKSGWYANPDGVAADMAGLELTSSDGYIFQTTIQAKYEVRENNQVDISKQATLYVSDIASKLVAENAKIGPALRMHINLGNQKYILVNPADSTGGTTNLTATYTRTTQYEWDTNGDATTNTNIDYQFMDGQNVATQVCLGHSVAENPTNYGITVTSGTAVNVVVTLWIEGFAEIDNSDDNLENVWWNESETRLNEFWTGFELTVKEAY